MLGPGNDTAAEEALAAWPGGMQVGGGINETNGREWIERGADKVSENDYLFLLTIVVSMLWTRWCSVLLRKQ